MTYDADSEIIRNWLQEASEIYDVALSQSGERWGCLLPVSDALVARIAKLGVEVSGYRHMLDDQCIRHINRQHGGQDEILRGQVPIVKQDILDLWQVMTEPDTIEISDYPMVYPFLTILEATKQVSGHTLFYVMEVRRKRRRLAPVTLFKRRVKREG